MRLVRQASEAVRVWLFSAVASLALLLLGPYTNFGPTGFLDPWYYTGYFTNFWYLVRHVGPTYYLARLPWILPGLLAFRVASPEVASVLLNLAIVTVSVVSLYWAVRWHYGQAAGVTASLLLIANPYFLSTVGWDYPDGPAIAYAFVGVAFAVRPAGRASRNSLLAGAFLALSGLTNMAAGPMILGVVTVLLIWRGRVRLLGFVAVGAIGVVVALCPVSQVLYGRWTYFYWQVFQAMHNMSNHFLEDMWGSGPAFFTTATRLVAPAVLLLLGPLLLRKQDRLPRAAWAGLLVCIGLYTIQEFGLHGAALRVPYHSSYMVVPVLLLAGVWLGRTGMGWRDAAVAAGLTLLLLATCRAWLWPSFSWPLLSVLSLAMAAVFLLWRYRSTPRLLPAVLMAALLFLAPAFDHECGYAWDLAAPVHGRGVDVFRHLMAFQTALKAHLDPARRVRFWFDRDEPGAGFYDSAESLYLWMHAEFTRDLAGWSAADLRRELSSNVTLVHLTIHPGRVAERVGRLAARGVQVGNRREWTMPYGGATLHIVLQDVKSPETSHLSPGF